MTSHFTGSLSVLDLGSMYATDRRQTASLRQLNAPPRELGHNIIIRRGHGKIGDFRQKSLFISEMVRDRPMVTMER